MGEITAEQMLRYKDFVKVVKTNSDLYAKLIEHSRALVRGEQRRSQLEALIPELNKYVAGKDPNAPQLKKEEACDYAISVIDWVLIKRTR